MARIVHPTAEARPPETRDAGLLVRLFFGVAAAPTAWSLQLIINYALASYPCMPNDRPYPSLPPGWGWDRAGLFAVNIIALLIAVAGGLVALRNLKGAPTSEPKGPLAGPLERIRFFAICGVLVSFGFVAAIVFNTVDLIGVPQCSG